MHAQLTIIRRSLVVFLLAAGSAQAKDAPTAADVIARIQQATGGADAWRDPTTVDTFKAGNPQTTVTGIATTFSATMEVLERAVAHHQNLIISHEPVFYNHTDDTDWLAGDPAYQRKRDYIEQHHLVLWRFHDHAHVAPGMPDMILQGMVAALNWQDAQDKTDPHLFTTKAITTKAIATKPITLKALAADIQKRLNIHMLRVVGDPSLEVTSFAFLPGASGRIQQITALRDNRVQALVAGESAEWETVLYTQDALPTQRKGLILLGHEPSEELGMQACAQWLKPLVPEVPVEFVAAGESFWSPR